MVIKKAEYITSATQKKDFIKTNKPVIAICGKSNVGKSSLINMIANRKNLARTSVTPGRTRMVNYFDFGEFILADLPGYGFAKVSNLEKQKWAKLMEEFFSDKGACFHVLSLLDIRHDPTKDDESMLNYLHHYSIPFSIITTKADKIGKTRIFGRVKDIGNYLSVGSEIIIPVSSQTGYNKDKLLSKLERIINIYNDDFFKEVEEDVDEEIDETEEN